MLGQPAFVAAHVGCDTQRKAFLAQQRIAAVARAVRPDFARFRVMHDVLGLVARPAHILLTFRQRCADSVHARYEIAFGAEHVEHGLAHARHDLHVHGHIRAVGQFDANVRNRRAQWAHAERHDIHRAALHAAVKQGLQRGAHFGRLHPVVGRAGVFFLGRADVGAVFDTGHVGRVGTGQEAVRALGFVELLEGAGLHQLLAHALVFGVATVAPVDRVGLAQGDHVGDPGNQFCILDVSGRIDFKPLHGRLVHRKNSKVKKRDFEKSSTPTMAVAGHIFRNEV